MSSYLNYSIQTREDFKAWILTMLGAPLITIELHDTQLEVAIDNAVEMFTKYCTQDQEYFAANLFDYQEGVGFKLPDNVQGVFTTYDSVMGSQSVDTLFSIPNQMYNAGIYPFAQGAGSSSDWTTYELAMQSVEFAKHMTGGGFGYNYNPRTKMLILTPDPIKSINGGGVDFSGGDASFTPGWVVVGCYTIREDTMQYGEDWVKKYALAESKIILGKVRKKFEGMQMLGGGTIDTSVGDEGITERDELIEKLRTSESGAYGFFMG